MIRTIFIFILLVAPSVAQAGFLDTIECVSTDNVDVQSGAVVAGGCTLTDITVGFLQLTQLLLGAIGAAALFYMAWGAFYWVTSMGFPSKVKKGQDIMLNTIFALLLTFSSYIILDFFVNRMLNVKEEFQITSECSGQSEGTVCNQSVGSNYVCDGSGDCITKCALKAKNMEQDWQCTYIENTYIIDGAPQFFELNLCPNDEHYVCTHVGDPQWDVYLQVIHDLESGAIDW